MTMQRQAFHGAPLGERRAATQWLGRSAMLWAALTAYCELCVLIHGGSEVGLLSSGLWALQTGAGWIIIGGVFGAFGDRIAASSLAKRRPYSVMGAAIVLCTVFAVACEAVLAGSSSLAALVYARAPISALASTLLVILWVVKHGSDANTSASDEPAPQPVVDEPSVGPLGSAGYGATDILDVMTGTGRTTIRIHDIECFRADRNYISVSHTSGRTYLLRQTMSSLERSLDPKVFERVHRSTIVNRQMVVERRPQGQLLLRSGATVQLSRGARKRAPRATQPS